MCAFFWRTLFFFFFPSQPFGWFFGASSTKPFSLLPHHDEEDPGLPCFFSFSFHRQRLEAGFFSFFPKGPFSRSLCFVFRRSRVPPFQVFPTRALFSFFRATQRNFPSSPILWARTSPVDRKSPAAPFLLSGHGPPPFSLPLFARFEGALFPFFFFFLPCARPEDYVEFLASRNRLGFFSSTAAKPARSFPLFQEGRAGPVLFLLPAFSFLRLSGHGVIFLSFLFFVKMMTFLFFQSIRCEDGPDDRPAVLFFPPLGKGWAFSPPSLFSL